MSRGGGGKDGSGWVYKGLHPVRRRPGFPVDSPGYVRPRERTFDPANHVFNPANRLFNPANASLRLLGEEVASTAAEPDFDKHWLSHRLP